MLKKVLANTVAKKTSVFVAVFAITCILMGSKLGSLSGEGELVQAVLPVIGMGQAAAEPSPPPSPQETGAIMDAPDEPTFPISGEYPPVDAQPAFGELVAVRKPQIDLRIPSAEGFVYSESIPMSWDLQKYTYDICVKKGLEYELVLALMWRESRFQTDAVGVNTNGTKDSGIMQINDVNKQWLLDQHGIDNLMDPIQNIYAGTTMLSGFTSKYGVHDGLMAYQYGESGMKQKISQGVVTNDKIAMLLEKRDDFRAILQDT